MEHCPTDEMLADFLQNLCKVICFGSFVPSFLAMSTLIVLRRLRPPHPRSVLKIVFQRSREQGGLWLTDRQMRFGLRFEEAEAFWLLLSIFSTNPIVRVV